MSLSIDWGVDVLSGGVCAQYFLSRVNAHLASSRTYKHANLPVHSCESAIAGNQKVMIQCYSSVVKSVMLRTTNGTDRVKALSFVPTSQPLAKYKSHSV
jgi:hypothetical protein